MDEKFKLRKQQREQRRKELEQEFMGYVHQLSEAEQKQLLDMMMIYARAIERQEHEKVIARRKEFIIIG